ncbi:MAG: DUF2181 domain-containing protein [Alphaproteobacteria bacterium]|nr:DUF2181 domain-containing protein [Alphaproteobacteria bacterium]
MQSLADALQLSSSADLQWVHGVNSCAKLEAACANASVHVLEADVYFEAADATPLLKDAPGAATELDLATFLTQAALANKAVKLDFHSPTAVEPTLALLRLLRPELPPILHADVFALLAPKQREEALEPEQFVRLVATQLPQAIISLGWSLKREADRDGRVEEALILQLAAMLTARLGPSAYGLEIRAGYRPTRNGVVGERGAALLLDPLPASPPAHSHAVPGTNVVSLLPRLRRVA